MCDPLGGYLDTRELLTDYEVKRIRAYWPEAIGIQILRCECAILLFRNKRAMRDAWRGHVTTLGGLELGYNVLEMTPSASPRQSGDCLTAELGDSCQQGACLGLKLKLPNGEDVITTVTHAFVVSREWNRITTRMASVYVKAKESLSKFCPPFRYQPVVAEVKEARPGSTDNTSAPSSLNKLVYVASTGQQVSHRISPMCIHRKPDRHVNLDRKNRFYF